LGFGCGNVFLLSTVAGALSVGWRRCYDCAPLTGDKFFGLIFRTQHFQNKDCADLKVVFSAKSFEVEEFVNTFVLIQALLYCL